MHRKRRGLQKVCGILPLRGYLLTRVFRFQEVQGKEEVKEGRIYTKKILCTAFYTTVASLAFGISSGGGGIVKVPWAIARTWNAHCRNSVK